MGTESEGMYDKDFRYLIESIYDYSYGQVTFKVVDYVEQLDKDSRFIQCSFVVKAETRDEDDRVIETTDHVLNISIPAANNALVTVGDKERVQITSGQFNPSFKFFPGGITFKPVYIRTSEDNISWPGYQEGNWSELTSVCKYLGVLDRVYPDLNPLDVPQLDNNGIEWLAKLEIDKKALDKLELMTEGKLKLTSNKLTGELLADLIDIQRQGPEVFDKYNEPTPLDYTFMTAIGGLIYEINESKRLINQQIRFNYDKHKELYVTQVQSIINRYFKLQADNFRNVQVPKISNAVSMMSQAKRIYFYDRPNRQSPWEKQQVYNDYFLGVLDPVRTSDGGLNNINNELTLDTDIKDGGVKIKVLNKDFEELELDYSEYMRHGLLLYDYIDYEKKSFEMKDGKYVYMKYGKYHETTDQEEFKYLRTYRNRLSPATACLPFINKMVSTRVILGSHFLDQSIPVQGAKPPVVSTPAYTEYYKTSPYNIRSKVTGVVTEIRDGFVKVRATEATERHKLRSFVSHGDGREYLNTTEHTTNEFLPQVKVGDEVKKGDVLVAMNSFVDEEFTTIVPLYTMYGTYLAHDHEDGIIITESAARKFSHMQYLELHESPFFPVSFAQPEDTVRFNQFGIINVGQAVTAGDTIMQYFEYPDDRDPEVRLANSFLTQIQSGGGSIRRPVVKKAPLNVRYGTVVKVNVHLNNIVNEITSKNKDFVEYYEAQNKESAEYYKSMAGHKKVAFEFEREDTLFTVEIVIRYLNTMEFNRLSGKLTNFYASKGVNTHIIPDADTPYDEFGNKIECIIGAVTLYSRLNPGQIYDTKMGLLGLELGKLIKKEGMSARVKEICNTVYPGGYDEKKLQSDVEKYGYARFVVSSFDTTYTRELILKGLEMLGLGTGDCKVYLPKIGAWTRTKCTVGLTSMMRLHFIQEYKAKATSDVTFETDNDNITYLNTDKDEGQKIGAQESWAFMAHGKQKVLQELQDSHDSKGAKFESALLMLGLKLE